MIQSINKIRLQVFLSRNGVCSRREALRLVQGGEVSLNGEIVREPSTPVDVHEDKICVGGDLVRNKMYEYILLNKPAGCVTTKFDKFADKTVLDLLPKSFAHLVPVGRLDKDTEGLLLLTNDGDTAYRLTHPKFDIDKTYVVRVEGELTHKSKCVLERGVIVDGKRTAPAKIRNVKCQKGKSEFSITIHEGRKRQIRLMLAKLRHKVVYLKRVAQGNLTLKGLKTGQWRQITLKEIGV